MTLRLLTGTAERDLPAIWPGIAPMAFGMAHNLLSKAGVAAGSRVLILDRASATGLACERLADILGASVERDAPGAGPVPMSFDAVIDLAASDGWRAHLGALRPGGHYARPGAIAEPARRGERRRVVLAELAAFFHPHPPREVFAGFITLVAAPHLRAVPPVFASKESAK